MIEINPVGGLGNQLFQYSNGRALALRNHTGLVINTTDISTYPLHSFGLDKFNIDATISSVSLVKGGQYREPHFHYDPNLITLPDNYSLYGYFQSERYFNDCRETLLGHLVPKVEIGDQTKSLLEKIEGCNSISVHFRRGDYISNEVTHSIHGTPSLDKYYKRAISMLQDRVPDATFFVFSDDIQWVKDNTTRSHNVVFVDHTTSQTNHEDLLMMSRCKHNIIANSSFSWWGAWLNQNPDKIVIYPKQWFTDKADRNTDDLFPETWEGL